MATMALERREGGAPLFSENPLKLMVFGMSAQGGCTMTAAEGTLKAEWEESVEVARLVEEAGIEGIVPYVRWKGMQGDTNPGQRNFETTTWAAGLAAKTERTQIFTTVLMPSVHPVMFAKQVATLDHISGGRAAANVVAGWFSREFRLFGSKVMLEHDERYVYADEWMTICRRLWTEQEPFTHDGRYLQVYDADSDPKPLQQPHPILMGAGSSPAGRAFAAKHCDINFAVAPDLEIAAALIKDCKEYARREFGREVMVFGMGSIVCRDTEAEVKRYVDYYVHEKGDWVAATTMTAEVGLHSGSIPKEDLDRMKALIIGGMGAIPLHGTPEQVVDGMVKMAAAGFDGITLNWPDYAAGLRQFKDELLPLCVQAGLRKG